MVALYDSFVYPFVVLFSIPVAIIGAFLALNLTMNQLSLFSLLGMIMLMGLVAKNAILIVDYTNQLKERGMHFKEALIEAGKTRMRPILMTTLAMHRRSDHAYLNHKSSIVNHKSSIAHYVKPTDITLLQSPGYYFRAGRCECIWWRYLRNVRC